MRTFTSKYWTAARQRWQDAYARHDTFASAGDDSSPEAEQASQEEYATLDLTLTAPAFLPGDVAGKLGIMFERDVSSSWEQWPTYMEAIQHDLKALSDYRVSPEMCVAFGTYRDTYIKWHDAADGFASPRDTDDYDTASTAIRALLMTPSVTAGDFIVKQYVSALDERSYYPGGGFVFLPATRFDLEYNEDYACEGVINDLQECDLGRLLFSTGRVTFNPQAWLDGMESAFGGKPVSLCHQPDGSVMFGISEPFGRDDGDGEPYPGADRRFRLLQQVINGGYGSERRQQVIAFIAENRPDLVFGAEKAA